MANEDVLIAGAGPTGLVLALVLAKCGVRCRIVDKRAGPGEASRAMVVQARTLEFYHQLGFAGDVVDGGIKIERIHLKERNHEAAVYQMGNFGTKVSPFSFALSYPQDDHERLLVDRLARAGIDVEWETELVDFQDDGSRVRANLRTKDNERSVEAAYLCGCDGAHSAVRQGLKLGFHGGTYDQVFYVADIKATGESAGNNDMNMCLSTNAFCLLFPIRSTGMNRAIGVVPDELAGRPSIEFTDLQPHIEGIVDIHVEKVNWFSTYHVHHRVADHFRVGRAFIAGDAGHVHSPAGGQGMNTGIGDAVNLGWKLASVVKGAADDSILDTYETERIAFAHTLVETTDKAFQLMVGRGFSGQLFRTLVVPHLAPLLFGFAGIRKEAFLRVSQTRINYRDSKLSQGSTGDLHGGDRLPWVDSQDNFDALTSFDWQIHVYGTTPEDLKDAARAAGIALHEYAWDDDAHEAGLRRDAAYLIRPDGYIAVAHVDTAELRDFIAKFKIAPRR